MNFDDDLPDRSNEDMFRQIWDTSSVKPAERFSYFREGVCQTYWATTPLEGSGPPIEARMARANLPRGCIAKLKTTAHRVIVTKADSARLPNDCFALNWFRSGGISGVANGRGYSIASDQVVLMNVNTIESFTLDGSDLLSNVGVVFGRPLLRQSKIGRLTVFDRPTDAALKHCLILADARFETASKTQMTDLFDAAVALLNASLVSDHDFLEEALSNETTARRGISVAIHNLIASNLANPQLSSTTIAAHFGITPRYVQKLFAEEGTTLKSMITDMRLEKVKNDLLDDTKMNLPLNEIAMRWGMPDMTTFHRNFRRKFGDTPNQVRLRRRRGPA